MIERCPARRWPFRSHRFEAVYDKGPASGEFTVERVRTLEALNAIVSNASAILVGALLLGAAYRCWLEIDGASDDGKLAYSIGGVLCCTVGGIPFVVGATSLADPWIWATLSNPDLWIAKRVLGL